jgi:DNA replication protein DnaC
LIIDEVGMQFGSDTEKMIIFDIIDGRYNNMLPTILISNLELSEVKELIGDRSIDRLREDGGVVVAMKWASNRGK